MTIDKAIYSPTTSTVNPKAVIKQLESDAKRLGIHFLLETRFISSKNNIAKTNNGDISYQYLINSAGLYADKIAKQFGFCKDYKIIPFRGNYLYSKSFKLNTNVYPVPNIEQPFLGTHFTVTHDGKVKIGPTATPAFWREQYSLFKRYSLSESIENSSVLMKLFINNHFDFRKLAVQELMKMIKGNLAKNAGDMLKDFKSEDFTRWGIPGIRAQLVNLKTNKLEMDYIYQGDDKTFHVLNAVSPAFTSSISFSRFLTTKIIDLIDKK